TIKGAASAQAKRVRIEEPRDTAAGAAAFDAAPPSQSSRSSWVSRATALATAATANASNVWQPRRGGGTAGQPAGAEPPPPLRHPAIGVPLSLSTAPRFAGAARPPAFTDGQDEGSLADAAAYTATTGSGGGAASGGGRATSAVVVKLHAAVLHASVH